MRRTSGRSRCGSGIPLTTPASPARCMSPTWPNSATARTSCPSPTSAPTRSRTPRPAPGPFPVLVYHHGGSWTRFTSTFTTEELASHGYVVVSVGHNGFNKTQFLPGGASVVPDTLTFPEPAGDLLADALAGWDFLDEHHFTAWVADAVFVLDQLDVAERLRPPGGAARPRPHRHVRVVLWRRDVHRDERHRRACEGGGRPRRPALRVGPARRNGQDPSC